MDLQMYSKYNETTHKNITTSTYGLIDNPIKPVDKDAVKAYFNHDMQEFIIEFPAEDIQIDCEKIINCLEKYRSIKCVYFYDDDMCGICVDADVFKKNPIDTYIYCCWYGVSSIELST